MKDNRKRESLNPQKILRCLISSTKGLRSLNTDTDLDPPKLNKENKLRFLQKLIFLIWDRLARHRDTSMQKKDATAGPRSCSVLSSTPRWQIYAFKPKGFSKKPKPAVQAETSFSAERERERKRRGLGDGTPPPARGTPSSRPPRPLQAGGPRGEAALPLSASPKTLFEEWRAGGQPRRGGWERGGEGEQTSRHHP